MQWSPHRETVEPSRRDHAYQLPRAPSSSFGSEMFCQEQSKPDNPFEDGQHVSIHKLGGTISPQLNCLDKELWLRCMERNILKAQHLAGVLNTIADDEARVIKDRSDWMLCPDTFHQINQRLGPLEMDLFASSLTHQLPAYASWRPDPLAVTTDAFTMNWAAYANPHWEGTDTPTTSIQSLY